MVFLKIALMCTKKVKLINLDCLPILILLYIMLAYLMSLLLYQMLFVCIMFFFAIDFCKWLLFSCFVLVY